MINKLYSPYKVLVNISLKKVLLVIFERTEHLFLMLKIPEAIKDFLIEMIQLYRRIMSVFKILSLSWERFWKDFFSFNFILFKHVFRDLLFRIKKYDLMPCYAIIYEAYFNCDTGPMRIWLAMVCSSSLLTITPCEVPSSFLYCNLIILV